MKQGTGSGFNTIKLYTIAASYTATKSTENILVMVVLFVAVYDAAIVYNLIVLKPDPVPCFMTF